MRRRALHQSRIEAAGPRAIAAELELCKRDTIYWFDNWVWTYNPKLAGVRNDVGEPWPTFLPFDLWPRQREAVLWMEDRIDHQEEGLFEKSRDIGFTWLAGGIAVKKWRWVNGFKTTFGSRQADLVDKLGDPDTIFEKIRMILRRMPAWMLPPGFDSRRHMSHMKIANPANGNTIVGEAGDDMGRGGRSSWYVIDEAAFVARADLADAATSGNCDSRLWGSSANGAGNLFYRKRFGGMLQPHQMFRFHYTDDPRKTEEWVAKKKPTVEPHIWASEYDIDYGASVEGICIPGKWVQAAKDIAGLLAAKGLRLEPAIKGVAGLDVGAGKAKSVFVARFGPIVMPPQSWGDPDTTATALRGLRETMAAAAVRTDGQVCNCKQLRFDEVGVGKGVLSTLTHHQRPGITTVPVNVGNPPTETLWPDGATAEEKFANLKAELWWTARARFKATYEMSLWLQGLPGGEKHALSDLVSLPPDSAGPDAQQLAAQLSIVKSGPNEKGKIAIETKKALATRGIASPDHAEAFILTFGETSVVDELKAAYAGFAPQGR